MDKLYNDLIKLFKKLKIRFHEIDIYYKSESGEYKHICLHNDKIINRPNSKASEHFEYANDELLSMSFHSPLDVIFNGFAPDNDKIYDKFEKLFEKRGYYFMLGNAWNLSLYKICEII